MKKIKQILSLCLVVVLLLSSLPLSASAASVTERENNNSIDNAQLLAFGDTVSGAIDVSNDRDYYKVVLPSVGKLTINTLVNFERYSLFLLSEDEALIWQAWGRSWNGNIKSRSDTDTFYLQAGTYYLLYNSVDLHSGPYQVTVNFTPYEDMSIEPNNTIDTAQEIAFGTEVKGMIALNDAEDYYALTLSESGSIHIDFTSYMQYYSMGLYDAKSGAIYSKKELKWDSSIKSRHDSVTLYLEAGTYYFMVNGTSYYKATGNYQFTVSFSPSGATAAEPNNTFATAQPIMFDAQNKGLIAVNDKEDIYIFTLPEAGRISIAFTSFMHYYSLFMYDSALKEIWKQSELKWSDVSESRSDTFTMDLEAGTYYLLMNGTSYYKATGNYEFMISFVSAGTNIAEPNNSLQEAKPISIGSAVNGQIAMNDAEDFYAFTPSQNQALYLVVNSYLPSIGVDIYGVDGNELWTSDEWIEWVEATEKRSISFNISDVLPAGATYFLRVRANKCTGNYQLYLVTANPEDYMINDQVIDTPTPNPTDPSTQPSTEPSTQPSTEPSTQPSPSDQQYITGDVNGDGKVTSGDARLALRAAVKLDKLNEEQTKAADTDKDGNIRSSDARKILRVAVKLDQFD